jgi:undecaprenyl-diphosphatase
MTEVSRAESGGWPLAVVRVKGWLAHHRRSARWSAGRMRRWERRHVAIGVVALVAVLAVVQVMLDTVAIVEARALPPAVQRFFNIITDYGKSGWFLWPLGVFLAVAAASAGRLSDRLGLIVASLATRAMFLFMAIALPGIAVNIVKGIIGRARPFVGGAADPYLFSPWTWRPAYASFPSGHTAAAASVAVAFGALWPRLRPILWIYLLAILVSRVVVTAHHPSDVLAGAVFGAVGAWLVRRYYAARGLGFAIDGTGRIYPMAGPSWTRITSWPRIKRVAAGRPGQ